LFCGSIKNEYREEFDRWQWVFGKTPTANPTLESQLQQEEAQAQAQEQEQRATLIDSIPKYYLSGNHDIGYDLDHGHGKVLADRFIQHFGPLNQVITIKGVEFVMVAATTLETSVAHPTIHQQTRDFLSSLNAPPKDSVRVLLTHVPLYRPTGTYCGPLRSRSKALRDGRGYSYVSRYSFQILFDIDCLILILIDIE